jgi:penicillin-insensitive murein endopeptidase
MNAAKGWVALAACLATFASGAMAQDKPAKELFGAARVPADLAARAIGSYARGCLAGGRMLSVNGEAWQAMRLSRNRNWGHPALVSYMERFARDVRRHEGWRGILVGDMSQPRGGPMLTGHSSHQVGLDADIWLTEMPDRTLTRAEREEISAVSMLKDKFEVDRSIWTKGHFRVIRRAASYPQVARIFVHPAIKKAMCEDAGSDRRHLNKVRPWWGHHYHFHVRLACPRGLAGCKDQPPVPADDGCGADLDHWYAELRKPPKPPRPPRPPMKLDALPGECRLVLAGPDDVNAAPAVADFNALASSDAGVPIPAGDEPDAAPMAANAAPLPARRPGAIGDGALPWLRQSAVSDAPDAPLPDRNPRR